MMTACTARRSGKYGRQRSHRTVSVPRLARGDGGLRRLVLRGARLTFIPQTLARLRSYSMTVCFRHTWQVHGRGISPSSCRPCCGFSLILIISSVSVSAFYDKAGGPQNAASQPLRHSVGGSARPAWGQEFVVARPAKREDDADDNVPSCTATAPRKYTMAYFSFTHKN